jgi:hypothetical protein
MEGTPLFPLFVRGGVLSPLFCTDGRNTPLSPLQKRGNQIIFSFLKSSAKNYSPLYQEGANYSPSS